jgi:hypothetical protein
MWLLGEASNDAANSLSFSGGPRTSRSGVPLIRFLALVTRPPCQRFQHAVAMIINCAERG